MFMSSFKDTLLNSAKDLGFDSGLIQIVDIGVDLAPFLGNLNQNRKINRAERRIREHAEQFSRIGQLFSSNILAANFIQENIGPIVLSDLIEEHEDAKINYILNGFENVFIEENTNEGIIINYFDTLRSLRYDDIKRLYFYSAITDELKEGVIRSTQEETFFQQIYTKLERLYLIKSASTWEVLEEGAAVLGDDQRKTELTPYGLDFIRFISKEFNLTRYQQKIAKYKTQNDKKLSQSITASFG
jgi:hypothetical protein